jgi:predicted nucleic acid-binding Zn ribbon protein
MIRRFTANETMFWTCSPQCEEMQGEERKRAWRQLPHLMLDGCGG